MQGLRFHFLGQRNAVYAIFKAGIIVNLVAQRHLSSGRQLLQYHHGESCPGGVQSGGEPGGPSAENDHIKVFGNRVRRLSGHGKASLFSVLL